MGETIQIYTTGYTAESQRDTINLTLEGVDPAQILAELPVDDIISYVISNLSEKYLEAVAEGNEE